jgi:hypothetical protein
MNTSDDQPASPDAQDPLHPTTYLDYEELNRFLVLIRDSYQKADLANLFLEQNCKVPTVNITALANLRDVLSHFSTFLRVEIAAGKREDQLTNAAEHLRRAILEPYELTYCDNVQHFQRLFQSYVEELLPARDQYDFLSSAPTRHNVELRLSELHELAKRGRLAKGNNDLIKDWEAGIACYIKAFELLKELVHEIEEPLYKFRQVTKESDLQQRLEEAYQKIADADMKHQQEICKTREENAKAHKHSARLDYIGIAIALILFIFREPLIKAHHFMTGLSLAEFAWSRCLGIV